MEMNIHVPQSYEASIELAEIAAVPKQIISPRHAKPVIGIVQDTLIGSYRLTQPNVTFNRREFMNMMMWNMRFNGQVPDGQNNKYTGNDILSQILPSINIDMGNSRYNEEKIPENYVKIEEGRVNQGVFDKDVFSKPSKGIVHTIYKEYGPKETVHFIDCMQNTITQFLIYNGFSVGISDLIADEKTKKSMDDKIQSKKIEVEEIIMQLHMNVFTNNTGKTNREEFENLVNSALNKARDDAGKIGLDNLSSENRLISMIKAGSKGSFINVAQMIACVGQQNPEAKRIPLGFTDRTLPHYKKYDDSAEARGFVESSFIRGLTPQEFFFHAMSGREGLIDTAVKSVTGDTTVVVIENGVSKYLEIGSWIDTQLLKSLNKVQHFKERDMEYLELETPAYIPTTNADGKVSWGEITAITRHDPGKELYEIKTLGGRKVIVTESKSLLIWNNELQQFEKMSTPDVRPGHYVPVTMNLPTPPIILQEVSMDKYLSKKEYLYGTDFIKAVEEMKINMEGREHIQNGWWNENNGNTFTLPYSSKAKLQRAIIRSNISNIKSGYIYPFTTNRDHALIPDIFKLNKNNGIFIGLFLAEGNVDITSGYVQITNNNINIRNFVKEWFDNYGIKYSENIRENHIGGTTSDVRGFSTILAQFLTQFVGHGAKNKYIPNEAYIAEEEFIIGLLNGYFSGDGTISNNSIEASSASMRLIEGISMLCSRLDIFGKVFTTLNTTNNLETKNILPANRISIPAQWANIFAKTIKLIDNNKQDKLDILRPSEKHRNFTSHNDTILDEITEINIIDVKNYPKVYDLTIPSTFNFGLANGLQVVDTADTGYVQRQLVKAMEDLVTQHDGTVRDAKMNIVQFHYGEDGNNSTMIEIQSIGLTKLSEDEVKKQYGEIDLTEVLNEDIIRDEDADILREYVDEVLNDRTILIEGIYRNKENAPIFSPVAIERLVKNIIIKLKLKHTNKTDLLPKYIINGIKKVIEKTQPFNKLWGALLRFHLAPHKLIKERFTQNAFDLLCELLVVQNFKAWAQPGEQVGIIAAQSIGEPSTQMSVYYDTNIVINGKKHFSGKIGKFIDDIIEKNKDKIIKISEGSVVLDLEEDYSIIGVSNDEKTSWKRISQVSRHPANGGLVKITLKSKRQTTATLSHSFLTRAKSGVVPILGSNLKVGMRVPIARSIPEIPIQIYETVEGKTTFKLTKEFGWICGIYLADGSLSGNTVKICKIHPVVEEKINIFATKYGYTVAIRNYKGAYGPGKDTSIYNKDLKDFLNTNFSSGSYDKTVSSLIYNSNTEFIQGILSGYFDGDGNMSVERQQIRVGSRSKELIHHMGRLLSYCGIFASFGEETSVRIPDKTFYTLQVLKKYAKLFKEKIGLNLGEKVGALNEIVEYMERDGKHDTKEIYDKIPELGEIIAETGKLLRMPGQSRNFGRWLHKESIGRLTLEGYIEDFEEVYEKTQKDISVNEQLQIQENLVALKSAAFSDILWDEIIELEILDDPKTFVYDFTVPGNDSFMVDDCIMVHNTLNSVDWDTQIVISKNDKIVIPQIGEFIDDYLDKLPEDSTDIQYLPNDQIYIELKDGNDWKAVSCDENGKMMWTQIEAITRHPVINDDGSDTILEVELESGRVTKATKGKSFLTLIDDKIVGINGSDLKIGDLIPIANDLALNDITIISEISLRDILPPTEWLYGSEMRKAVAIMETSEFKDERDILANRHWFKKNQGVAFTVPYTRSDGFRDAFQNGRNTNTLVIREGFVYPKRTRPDVSQIPETIQLTKEFGYFVGAYLAEGMSNDTQICITNNEVEYLNKIKEFMDGWNVGSHLVCEERVAETTGIKGKTTSLIIHSTLLAKVMKHYFGRVSYEKTLPDWVLQAPDDFVKGLVDAYICGDGSIDKRNGTVSAGSVSKELLIRLSLLLSRYGIFSKMSNYMPEINLFKTVSRFYNLQINVFYSSIFAEKFPLSMERKQEILDFHFKYRTKRDVVNKKELLEDVVFDVVKSIKEVKPLKKWVYDLTVKNTRNFMAHSGQILMDTFHLAGVSSKSNVTRGVPRLKELLKVTHNPKAISLTIPLKKVYRDSIDKARTVAQDLELTLLRDIVTKTAIYFDPSDENTILKEDQDLIKFYTQFETEKEEPAWSKWLLRLEFDSEAMFTKNITTDDVAFALNQKFSDNTNLIYSDYNSNKLIMRIRLSVDNKESKTDDILNLKKMQNTFLNSIIIKGLQGIKSVAYRKDTNKYEDINGKYEQITQYILDTDGSNFLEISNHPYVDGNGVLSSHVHDIFENLGIEAARITLLNEITSLFADAGGVDYRHLGLLCDWMTRIGKLLSVDRYGINKQDIGPLAKASFEETEKILLKAAVFGEVDPITGVSANIMTGQPIRGGTSFSDILLDEVAFMRNQEGLSPTNEDNENEEEDDEEEDILYESPEDKCSTVNLKMNVVMPQQTTIISEPDIEMVELKEDD